uniref:RAN binding protein 2 n=1 Tax=Petromyzon marinus TaxID=7757 RepID=S4RRU6_PETMA
FEPVVPLPDKVEVKTGEEDEEELYCNRAKLFRFDADSKEWKERGVGNFKILCHHVSGKLRVLMRREQVLKICANHYITAEMTLNRNAGSDKSWVWHALDFADEVPRHEQLAIKFKTAEEAVVFRTKFEEAQQLLKNVVSDGDEGDKPLALVKGSSKQSSSKSARAGSQTPVFKLIPVGFGAKFEKKEGEWDCSVCVVRNKPDADACIACLSAKPGGGDRPGQTPAAFAPSGSGSSASFPDFKTPNPGAPPESNTFTEGLPSLTGVTAFQFGLPTESDKQGSGFMQAATNFAFGMGSDAATGFSFGIATGNSAASSTAKTIQPGSFSFTQASTTTPSSVESRHQAPAFPKLLGFGSQFSKKTRKPGTEPTEKPPAPLTGFGQPSSGFGSSMSGFTFGTLTAKTDESGFSFGSLAPVAGQASAFKFATQEGKESIGKVLFGVTADADTSGQEDSNEMYKTEEDDEIHFEPVVQMPDKVDLVTGEEEEEVCYSQRAKLFRFDTAMSQWKERGVGDIKILRNKQTGRTRILMRREQVLKVCANHCITTSMSLNPMKGSDRAWVWVANDFSEGEPKVEQLAVKFKTPDVGVEFKAKFEECQRAL